MQSHPKKHCAALFWISPLTFMRVAIQRPKVDCLFAEPLIADGLVVASFTPGGAVLIVFAH